MYASTGASSRLSCCFLYLSFLISESVLIVLVCNTFLSQRGGKGADSLFSDAQDECFGLNTSSGVSENN